MPETSFPVERTQFEPGWLDRCLLPPLVCRSAPRPSRSAPLGSAVVDLVRIRRFLCPHRPSMLALLSFRSSVPIFFHANFSIAFGCYLLEVSINFLPPFQAIRMPHVAGATFLSFYNRPTSGMRCLLLLLH